MSKNHLSLVTCYLLLAIITASLVGCATGFDKKGGVYYKVRSGETLQKIAKSSHVSVQDLAEWNNIQSPDEIQPGLKLYIPKTKTASGKRGKGKDPDSIQFDRSRFSWPVDGYVMSQFGIRNGHRHDGIDIKAETGDPIKPATNGKVVFSGVLRGYGNMIIIKHADKFYTVYAHNSKNKVKKGQKVAKNDVIGYVGATGRATGPHLHFEVREGMRARNPLFLLPPAISKNEFVAVKSSKLKAESSKEKVEDKKVLVRREKMMEELKTKKAQNVKK